MAVARPNAAADAARQPAQVWVPDIKEGYLAGLVLSEDEEAAVVELEGGEVRRVPFDSLFKMNPPKFDRVEDIADLTFLNEASVVHNLRLRYYSGAIYTYSGLFLVAINPYQSLPLYTDVIIQQYRNKRRDDNPPHIFAVAERAWVNMGDERENQSILITGESGAGKTESTKKVIQYLAAIATDTQAPVQPTHTRNGTIGSTATMPSTGLSKNMTRKGHFSSNSVSTTGPQLTSKGRLGLLERQILQANPILEAFGNAQTQRNNNSSRFGKFVRISFAPDGSIAGANIDWYLLEKSRVVYRNEAERNFHVFYQLLAGGRVLKDALLLNGDVENYEYLNKSRREIDGIDDAEEWNALKVALDVVGFTQEQQFDLFRVVAAVLHIGNIVINSTRADDATMQDTSQAERACHLLGIPLAEFTRAVLRPRALAGREWVTQARTRRQALDELAALCKTLYEKSFGALVDHINRALDRPSSKSTFIGVLDIAGFEIFEVNGYEQLLINYTNEKLQQFFNHHMFILEQEEYARQNIKWDYVNFGLDLQPTIDLIESTGNVIGILSCLDEECIMPKATDLTFTNKLHALWASGEEEEEFHHPGKDKYEPTRFEQGFIIQHYAAKVDYRTEGWLDKNKDPLNDNLTRVLAASSEPYIAALFAEYGDMSLPGGANNIFNAGKKRTLKKGAFRTVGQRHREQLSSLMTQLRSTQPHFVRCIVPNNYKKPHRIDVPIVLDQLRCNGVLEGIRIARLGYPNRLPFVEFRQRYEILTPGIIPRGYMDGREACRRMVSYLELDESIFKIGTSKIFFKAGVLAELEERRDLLLYEIFTRVQASARMWTARRQMKKILNRAIAIRTIQRNARVYNELREWPWWQLYTKVRPLLAATRSDEELRKKELELTLIKERAERDKKEREALENLKMALESEKNKVEEALEAERALAMDKDALLERSKKRESELEEEVAALQSDLDLLDSQLDRAMKLQKESEEKYESLKEAFDQAAEHLVRMEAEQKEWAEREAELLEELTGAREECDTLLHNQEELRKVGEELKNIAVQQEEDLGRTRERLDSSIRELEGKLESEQKAKEALKTKSSQLENEARLAKEQLAEVTRSATEYSDMITKKEEQIRVFSRDLDNFRVEGTRRQKEIAELRSQKSTLEAQLQAERQDSAQEQSLRITLQKELDDLRSLLQAKTSEETRRNEVEKSKEAELADLRNQVSELKHELMEVRRNALDVQSKLELEKTNALREQRSLESSYNSLLKREGDASSQLSRTKVELAELEKSKRSMESELQTLRTRQIEMDSQLSEAVKNKENLERQLNIAQARYKDFEDVVLEHQREKENNVRQLETARKELEVQSTKRAELEKFCSGQKAELMKLKDRNVKLDRELNKALKDLKDREWEIKQLESRQDKTIVEHVHVLEEAKRVTDRQLAEAQLELQKNQSYIRSLEKTRGRLMMEAEDLTRETEKEKLELRQKEKNIKLQEERATRALADVEKERQARDTAALEAQRLRSELEGTRNQANELAEHLAFVQKAKENLESELERLADESVNTDSLSKIQRQYETRITQLEEQLEEAEMAKSTAAKIRENIERQHAEIRRLVMQNGPRDSDFQNRLLQELKAADSVLEREMNRKTPRRSGAHELQTLSNLSTPTKNKSPPSAPTTPSVDREAQQARANSDRQVTVLKQHVQVLELQMAASDRVRHHLEMSLRELTAELENSDGSKQFLQQYRARLTQENSRLAELLKDEADARRTAEAAQVEGIQAMWAKFQKTIANERDSYSRLEESRKALLVQQRNAQAEIEAQKGQIREFTHAKKQLQKEAAELRERLESLKNETSNAKRQLQKKLQDDELKSTTSAAAESELKAAIQSYQQKEQGYLERLEATEIARATAARGEAYARRTLETTEKALADTKAEADSVKKKFHSVEKKLRSMESKLEEEGREASDLAVIQKRLEEELDDEREQHQKDLAERDFTIDQTRKKYQAELAQLSEELQSQRDSLSRLREENRKIRSDFDELQLRYDDEVYNSGGWKKEKERMETKIQDITKAFEASTHAQSEQQAQIVALHQQVRELRAVLDDAEAERAMLQKARRALQAELETIKIDHVDTNRSMSDTEFQRLQLKKQDLERTLEEQGDRVSQALDRMKKAEAYATECFSELERVRKENSTLDRQNAQLEKQVKELNVRIVDLETRSYANSPRPTTISRRVDSRIEELTNQLNQSNREKGTMGRSAEKLAKDTKFQQSELERQRIKFEDERKEFEARIQDLRNALDTVQTKEHELQAANRRVTREAVDYKQRNLNLEREMERLQSRLGRPASSSIGSPHSSPRK
ncbi:hypothetical protein D9756_007302 [Leucocoprinus leucothites]|uniref:Nonmuscle myosin heavy chain b n=1 Tax=Leucocoprinus leucothites TaxID=201217 RepID=A0A8H5D6Y1_9AGAR|nr:hypothetical protein D9756_007302 [Leucoagaricus leucothites]